MWLVSIEPQIMKVYSQGRLINDLCIVKPVYTDNVTWADLNRGTDQEGTTQ